MDLSVEWRALFDGSLVGEVAFARPQLNFVADASRAEPADRRRGRLAQTVEDLFPVKINRVTVRDGSLHFRAFDTEPQVDVYLRDLDAVAENLTNSRDLSEDRVAQIRLRATPMNAGSCARRWRSTPSPSGRASISTSKPPAPT